MASILHTMLAIMACVVVVYAKAHIDNTVTDMHKSLFKSRGNRDVSTTPTSTGALSTEQRQLVVDVHNYYRRNVDPPAANMLKMEYDVYLEETAVEWAQYCYFEHPVDQSGCGQNIWLGTNNNVTKGVTSWQNEGDDYTLATEACTGATCGHYLQNVYWQSYKVGCAWIQCDCTLNSWSTGENKLWDGFDYKLLICNYKPARTAGVPYTSGDFCTDCPFSGTCDNDLCDMSGDVNAAYPSDITDTCAITYPSADVIDIDGCDTDTDCVLAEQGWECDPSPATATAAATTAAGGTTAAGTTTAAATTAGGTTTTASTTTAGTASATVLPVGVLVMGVITSRSLTRQ